MYGMFQKAFQCRRWGWLIDLLRTLMYVILGVTFVIFREIYNEIKNRIRRLFHSNKT